MKKQAIQFDSPLDALLAIARRLSRYESEAGMDSEDFFARYTKGEIGDDARFVDWANDYRHYLSLRSELDNPPPPQAPSRLHDTRDSPFDFPFAR